MGISLPTNPIWLLVGGKPYTLGHQGQTLVQSLIFSVTLPPVCSGLSQDSVFRTLPPASWPQTVLGGQGEALVALNPQRYPGSFSGFAHSAGLGLSVLLPSQSAFQPSQHFWAPPTFISFPACGLGTEGKPTCPSWGQCQAMLRPVGPQNPQDVVWLRVCLSVGVGSV